MGSQSHIAYVHYRIQNVDFTTYLELYNINDPTKVVLRPSKSKLVQQWKFIPVNGSNQEFKILNAGTESLTTPLYLTATATSVATPDISCSSESQAKPWTIKAYTIDDSSVFSITCTGSPGSVVFLTVDDNGKLACVTDNSASLTQPKLEQDRQWTIAQVASPLNSNTYMIRNLNGAALHMRPGGEISTEKVNKGAHEKWVVQVYGNGKCTIKNAKEDLFLSWDKQTKGVFKAGKSAEQRIWIVKDIGGYTYAIMMDPDASGQDSSTPLLLSWQDDNQVVLKQNTIAHNRVWIFEPADPTETDTANVWTPTVGKPLYAEIQGGGYDLKNVETAHYIFKSSSTDTSHITYGSYGGYKWIITYMGSPGEFLLYSNDSNQCGSLTKDTNVLFIETPNAESTKWVLERAVGSNGFSYYICPANHRTTALTHEYNASNSFPALPLKLGNRHQLWNLIPM